MSSGPNPFPGLRPFETRDRLLFFGRERPAADLLTRLRERRLVAVVGSSGSGKSSLVRAGLLPELHGGFMVGAGPNWTIAVMRPGGDPVGNLAAALAATGRFGSAGDPTTFTRTTLARSARGLIECVQQSQLPPGRNLLVVVDQFEEVFRFRQRSRTIEEESGAFVRLLLEATGQTERPIYVVLTMRSDYLGDCAEFSGLAEAVNDGQFLVPRMNREELRLAIEGPVRVAGGQIAARLVQRLLNDVGTDRDQLPVLQHALMRMWDLRAAETPPSGALDLRHYEAVGTMSEALSRHLDEVYSGLPGDAERTLAEALFKALTELGHDNRGIRRPTRLKDLCRILALDPAQLSPVIDRFRQPGRTFLMPPISLSGAAASEVDEDPGEPDVPGEPEHAAFGAPQALLEPGTVIDISHESLMRVWARLRQWVDEEAASAGIYRRLAESAQLCEEGRFGVYRDPELQIALNWRDQNRPTAAWADRYAPGYERAIQFLERSVAEREAIRSARRRRRRALVGGISAAALVFFLLAMLALGQKREAVRQQRIAESRLLAMRAENQIGRDPRKSVLLALEAVKRLRTESAAVNALRKTALASRLRRDNWVSLAGFVGQASMSPDGQTIVAAAGTNAYVFDLGAVSTNSIRRLDGHTDLDRVAAFSHDGASVLTAGWDGQAILWDTKNWSRVATLTGHREGISRAVFGRDDRTVATASRDGTGRVWEVPSGRFLAQVPPQDRPGVQMRSIAFNPDGDEIALGTDQGQVEIWRWSEQKLLWQTNTGSAGGPGSTNPVVDLAFASNHRYLAAAVGRLGTNGLVYLWKSASNQWELPHRFDFRQNPINALALSPDDQWLAVSGKEGTGGSTVLFDVQTEVPVYTNSQPEAVVSVSFSRDGRSILTASDTGNESGRLRLWDVGLRRLPTWSSHNGVKWTEFTPDEEFFIAANGSTNLWVHRASDGAVITNLTGHLAAVSAGVVLPRAQRLITADSGRSLRVWNLRTWSQVARQSMDREPISMALSPDGRWLVVTHFGASTLWQTEPLKVSRPLEHAGQSNAGVLHAAFSADGRRFVTTSQNGSVVVWHTGTWEGTTVMKQGPAVQWAEFAPDDSARLVTAADTIRFYLYTNGQWIVQFQEQGERRHLDDVAEARFGPSGACVVSSGYDGRVLLWDASTGQCVGELPVSPGSDPVVARFAAKGRELFTFGTDARVHDSRAWAPLDELVRDLEAAVRPLVPLSAQELGR